MPYRLNPTDKTEVQVKRNGRWVRWHKHATVKKARAQLAALKMSPHTQTNRRKRK